MKTFIILVMGLIGLDIMLAQENKFPPEGVKFKIHTIEDDQG